MRLRSFFHIGGKVEKSLNKHTCTKGYKGHLLKKKLVDELLISVSCLDILKYENHAHSHKRNCKDLLKNIKKINSSCLKVYHPISK